MYSVQIKKTSRIVAGALALSLMAGSAGQALDRLEFSVPGAPKALEKELRAASILLAAEKSGNTDAQDVFTDARAEYASLLNALYARGYYSAVIHVYVDGVEAASIAPLDAPGSISAIKVVVEPGPEFAFSQARIAPLARRTELPEGFAVGKTAESGVILEAVTAGVNGWRAQSHAKAEVSSQKLTADHKTAKLAADVELNPGPKLRFGPLTVNGAERMRLRRVRAIAGLPEGEAFSPAELERVASRLRRTGVFKSVTLTEDDFITAPDLLGITLTLVEEKKRRYTFGAELSSNDGATLNGAWLHRNLFGGGERLKVSGDITNIGATDGGADFAFGISLERPATFTPDTTAGVELAYGKLNEADFDADLFSATVTLSHVVSEQLSGKAGLSYDHAIITDPSGESTYKALSLPVSVIWDRRDNKTDATRNIYAAAEVKPFLGFGITDSGVRATLDLRGYKSLGEAKRLVLAGRVQAGAVFGASLLGTPRDYLFYSGGGGTVRGQPYQSLGVNVLRDGLGDTYQTGGKTFMGASFEARMKVTESIGVVGFVDMGRIDANEFFSDLGDWHAGAGIGLRYATPVGPIRLDLAGPVGGNTGDGIQVYVGLGQAF
ncbi:autotransporter assembly complex family protein [Cypionkella sp.]|uniref:autotransporter assembly complex protein TamA n=1 Tax=Cypionkella sp. TaxID=2811411 RepID=UPI002ABB16D6|nr:autotransporter assembly complex family protein [Cypionkella sp.]MDZ4393009.1 autotransporter assembly complex family protein [Cypionkella sp.]